MSEGAHRDDVHAGVGDGPHGLQIHAAGGLQPHPTPDPSHGFAEIVEAEIVQHHHVRRAGESLLELDQAVDLDLDLHQVASRRPGAPDVVMLDNFSLEDLREAVRRAKGLVRLEASGGVTLSRVRSIAETGVDVISVGALTHSAAVLDIGLDVV